MSPRAAIELGSAFTGRFISAGGVLAISVLLSRQLPLAEAGKFFEAFAVLMGAAILTRCGQELRLLRAVAQKAKRNLSADELVASSSLVVAASVLAGLPFLAWSGLSGPPSPLKLIWLPLIPAAMTNVIAAYFKGLGRSGLGALAEVGGISLVATGWFIVFPAQDALSAWLVLSIAAWLVGLGWWGIAVASGKGGVRIQPLRMDLLTEGRHLWLVSVLSYVSQWGIVLLVALTMSPDAVAIVNALLRLLAPMQFVALTLDYFVAPRFARGTAVDINRVRQRSIWTGITLTAPYAAILLVQPTRILTFVYGADYGAYGNELRILIIGMLCQTVLGPNGILLNMLSRDRDMLRGVVLRIIVNFVAQLFLFVHPAVWIAAAAYSLALFAQAAYSAKKASYAIRSRHCCDVREPMLRPDL